MITTLDACDAVWRRMGDDARDAVCAWLRRNGQDPDVVTTVTILGEGQVGLTRYLLNEHGHKYVVDGEVAKEDVVAAILEPPPPEWP